MEAKKFLIVLPLLALACANNPSNAGRAYYIASGCQSCHRIGSIGGTGGPDLTLVGFRRSKEWLDVWLKNPKAWKPDTKMPDSRLSDKTRQAIVEYMVGLKGQNFNPDGPPWRRQNTPIAKGQTIYSKAGCVACHGRKGAGGHPNNNVPGKQIPALAKTVPTYKPEELKEKIRKGVTPEKLDPHGPDPLVFMPAWGKILNEEELDAVVAYLFTITSPEATGEDW